MNTHIHIYIFMACDVLLNARVHMCLHFALHLWPISISHSTRPGKREDETSAAAKQGKTSACWIGKWVHTSPCMYRAKICAIEICFECRSDLTICSSSASLPSSLLLPRVSLAFTVWNQMKSKRASEANTNDTPACVRVWVCILTLFDCEHKSAVNRNKIKYKSKSNTANAHTRTHTTRCTHATNRQNDERRENHINPFGSDRFKCEIVFCVRDVRVSTKDEWKITDDWLSRPFKPCVVSSLFHFVVSFDVRYSHSLTVIIYSR